MNSVQIQATAVEKHYATLNNIGLIDGDLENGFFRPPYSDTETAAIAYIQQCASAGGLSCRSDEVGNLIVETPGQYCEWIETGSHLDTVPGGGNFDGLAGICCRT